MQDNHFSKTSFSVTCLLLTKSSFTTKALQSIAKWICMSSWALSAAWLQLFKWKFKDLNEQSSIFLQSREYHPFLSVHTCIDIFENGVCTGYLVFNLSGMVIIWFHGRLLRNNVQWYCSSSTYSRCYWCKRVSSFPEFDMQVACLFISFCLICFCHLSKGTFTRRKTYIVTNEKLNIFKEKVLFTKMCHLLFVKK